MAYILETTWGTLLNHRPLPDNYFTAQHESILVVYKQETAGKCSQPVAFIDTKKKTVPIVLNDDVSIRIDGLPYVGMSIDEAMWKLFGLVLNRMDARLKSGQDAVSKPGFSDTKHPIWIDHTYVKRMFSKMVSDKMLRTLFLMSDSPIPVLWDMMKALDYHEKPLYGIAPPALFSGPGISMAFLLEALVEGICENGNFHKLDPYLDRLLDSIKQDSSGFNQYDKQLGSCRTLYRSYKVCKDLFDSEDAFAYSMRVRREIIDTIGNSGPGKVIQVSWDTSNGVRSVSAKRNHFSIQNGSFGESRNTQDCYWMGLCVSSAAFSSVPETDQDWFDSGLLDNGYMSWMIPYYSLREITDIHGATLWKRKG